MIYINDSVVGDLIRYGEIINTFDYITLKGKFRRHYTIRYLGTMYYITKENGSILYAMKGGEG